MIGACLVGAGRIANLHILGYLENPQAQIVAVCDKNKKRAKALAAEVPAKVTIFDNLDDALKDPAIDLVEILTPHQLHEEQVIKAAEAGKHISCQKVPALTLPSFDRMTQAARKAGVKFRVFENFRFHPPYQRAMRLIHEGVIGEVEVVNTRFWGSVNPLSEWEVPLTTWKWRISEGQNYKSPTLFDDGYHKHSIIAMYFGDLKEKIRVVRAWSKRQRIKKVVPWDTPAVIIYETKTKSKYGLWNVSLGNKLPIKSDYYGCDEFVEIQGEHGLIFINGCTGNMFCESSASGPGQPGVYWMDESGKWHEDTAMPTNWKHSFINCTKHFIDALVKEDATAQLEPKIARYILQIDLAAIKSTRLDAQPVKVDSITDGI